MALDLDWAANFNLSQRKNDFLVVDSDPDSDAPAVPRDILLRGPDSDGVSFRATLNDHMILVDGVSLVTINARGDTTKSEVLSISGGPTIPLVSTVYDADLVDPILDINPAGDITILPVVDSLAALQVQQADTSVLFDLDTINARVGIGIAAPLAKLHVFGTADEVQGVFQAVVGQSDNIIEIQDSGGSNFIEIDPNGQMGIGRNPTAPLDIRESPTATSGGQVAAQSISRATHGGSSSAALQAIRSTAQQNSTQAMTNIHALRGYFGGVALNNTGLVTGAVGVHGSVQILSGGEGSSATETSSFKSQLTSATGITAAAIDTHRNFWSLDKSGSGVLTVTNLYGFYSDDIVGATNNWALVTNAGNVVLNDGNNSATDLRVKTVGLDDAFFVQGSTDDIGMGTDTPAFELEVSRTGASSVIGVTSYGGTARVQGRSSNGTEAFPTASTDDNLLLSFRGFAHDGTSFFRAADVEIRVDGTPAGDDIPGAVRIVTHALGMGAGTIAERWRITPVGNMGLNTPTQFGSGVGVFGIADAGTNPSSNPAGGGVLYSDAGAGKWRGSGGTTTTFGPAEPHCPDCGRDFVLEWQNDMTGHLVLCMWCFSEGLEKGAVKRASN